MANYKEQTVSGSAWQRASQVQIHNPLNGVPGITFYEEEAVLLPSGPVIKHVGHISESFSDPLKEFPLVNPETGDVIGVASYQQIYLLLHSLYMHLAGLRDQPAALLVGGEEPV